MDARTSQNRWWTKSGKEAASAVSTTLELLETNQTERMRQYVASGRLYGHRPPVSSASARLPGLSAALKERIDENAIQIGVDTIVAKIRKNRPKPYFLTNGGDWKLQRKAKKLNKFVEGAFYDAKIPELAPDIFRDGAVWGTGAVHVFERNGRACAERTLPDELWIDEVEAANRNPRQLHRKRNLDRMVLADAMPKHKKEILAASLARPSNDTTISDLVTVVESWHLPSGPGAKDGRHKITIMGPGGAELLDEPWTKSYFPFAFFHWCRRLTGWWGQGGVEQQQNNQLSLNKLNWVIDRSLHLGASFKLLLHVSSKVVSEHANNEIGALVKWAGDHEPKYVLPPLVQREYFDRVEHKKQAIYEGLGISGFAARAEKPRGLVSGEALREYKDETSERLATPGENYEFFHLDLARLFIDVAKDIAKNNGGSYEVRIPGRKFLQTVDWKDVDLEEDQYVMQCFPVSSLPSDPAGRTQTVQEWVQAGWLTARQGKRLINFPDLDAVENLQNAAEDYLTELLDNMVDEGKYEPPEPYDDLAMAREMALEYYALGKRDHLDEDRLEMLRVFLVQLDVLQAPAANSNAVTAPAAAPAAPPTSDLIPNVPQQAA